MVYASKSPLEGLLLNMHMKNMSAIRSKNKIKKTKFQKYKEKEELKALLN